MWMIAANYRRTHSPSRLAWSEGWRPAGAQSTFIGWPGELSQWLWSRWQHHKHCHGYYYVLLGPITTVLFAVAADVSRPTPSPTSTATTRYVPVRAPLESEPAGSCRQKQVRGVTWPTTSASTWATAHCPNSPGRRLVNLVLCCSHFQDHLPAANLYMVDQVRLKSVLFWLLNLQGGSKK